MCLLAIFFRVVEDAPLVIGANREEFYNRPGEPPQILEGPARAIAGIDSLAQGTWLGVNDRGMVVAVTNRKKSNVPPQPRSRGLLAREMLECTSISKALDLAQKELDLNRYAGCNIICSDQDRVVIFEAGDWLRIKPLPPGLHVVANENVNDGGDRRVNHALNWLCSRDYANSQHCLAALQQLCCQNGDPPICLHGQDRGTVSSSLLCLRDKPDRSLYHHAQGPPDQYPYQDFSFLLSEMTGGRWKKP